MGTLERAGIETTLVARSLVDELEIVVASDREASVSRLRTAGANDVLSLPNVAARMISLRVFDRETMILGERVSIARVETADLETEELEHDERETIRDRTGCSIVGLEYDGHLTTDVQAQSLTGSDALVIAGSQTDVETFSSDTLRCNSRARKAEQETGCPAGNEIARSMRTSGCRQAAYPNLENRLIGVRGTKGP